MASAYSPLFAASTHVRISALLTWILLLMQVDAQNLQPPSNGSEIARQFDILLKFKAEMRSVIVYSSPVGSHGYLTNIDGLWQTWNDRHDDPCAWAGVLCNSSNSTVEGLDLSGWGLQWINSLSWEYLCSLQDLRALDLSYNDFMVGAAIVIGDMQNMTKLAHLDLSSSGFQGTIPTSISTLQSLQYLSLEHNKLQGEIPYLGRLVNLQVLRLAKNQLTGKFPLELGHIRSLVTIDLSHNKLDGTIPSLSNLTDLVQLKLDENLFTEFEEPLYSGTARIEHLSASRNQLKGVIPSSVTKLPNLRVLNMSHNRLSGYLPSELQRSYGSFSLDLSDNQLEGTISAGLLNLADIMSVNLSNNLLVGSIPPANASFYDVLDLSNNNLSGLIPIFFDNNSTIINSLCLQNNRLSGDIVDVLLASGRNTPLKTTELRMGNNNFTGDLSRIAEINNTMWPYLNVVDLSNNYLQMSTTTTTNPLSGVLEFFMGGTFLKEIYIGGNNFSGASLPTYFSRYTNTSELFQSMLSQFVEVLDLSNSHLKGEILGDVFNSTWLPSVRLINLSHNDVTGPIPESISTLRTLEILDVSNNKLCGQLPPQMSPVSRLYYRTFLYSNNSCLCGDASTPCHGKHLQWWVMLAVLGSGIGASGSFLVTAWQWRAYRKRHQQDADLIKTLIQRESTSLMSCRELKKATDNFVESAKIGEGGFGIVYKGKLNDGTIVAIKKSKHEGTEKYKQQFLNEVRILSQVNHRNLVKLLGCCMENNSAFLVFEFISNGNLLEHLQGKVGAVCLTWNQRLRIAIQTADALHYLHSAASFPIYHRDIKSTNILLDKDLNAKVADFGISRLAPLRTTHVSTMAIQGTFGYIDPEYYTTLQLTDKSDVYSFGVVLLELISAKPTLDSHRGSDETSLVLFASRHIKTENLEQLLDPSLMETYNDTSGYARESILNVGRLAMKCLNMRSKARPSMNEVWKELQEMWLELFGMSEPVGSSNDDLEHDYILSLSNFLASNSLDTVESHTDDSGFQMSHLTRVRSRSSPRNGNY